VNGTGTTIGALADMLAAATRPDVWAGHHAAPYVEAQVVDFVKSVVDFPAGASAVLVSGASTANLVCTAAAREAGSGDEVSSVAVRSLPAQLVMDASEQIHIR
jgi:glutamate/tyrosine decarboxylase-like PLP-dependent enzyme